MVLTRDRRAPPPLTQAEGNELLKRYWNMYDGFLASGTFVPAVKYVVAKDGDGYFYAVNGYQTIYGGPDDIGVSGLDFAAVLNAAIDDADNGDVAVVNDASFTDTIVMKSGVRVLNKASLTLTADVDGFDLDGIHDSGVIGGLATANHAAYSHALIKLHGVDCKHNKISDIVPYVTYEHGNAILVSAENGESCYGNTFSNVHGGGGACTFKNYTDGTGWITKNEWFNVESYLPTANYGFGIYNDGASYGGNSHHNVWVQLDSTVGACAFYMEGSAGYISGNMFLHCQGIDYGATNSYFLKLGSLVGCTRYANDFIGCHSNHNDTSVSYENDFWTDLGTNRTVLNYPYGLVQHYFKPRDYYADNQLVLAPSLTTAAKNGIRIDNKSTDSKEFVSLLAEGTQYNLDLYTDVTGGYTQRCLYIRVRKNATTTNVAYIEPTTATFIPLRFVMPWDAPPSPTNGMMYFDPNTYRLYVYTVAGWRYVSVVGVP